MAGIFANDTEPETDYAVWGFYGDPPQLAGGQLAEDDHHADARLLAQTAGWDGDAACYLVDHKTMFEAAVHAAGLQCANFNEIDSDDDDNVHS
jgi:hypothetical protein